MLSAACAPRCGARPALDSRAHRASTHAPEANNCSGSARVRRQRRLHASRSASRSRSAAPAPSYSCSCCTPKRASAAHHQDRLEGRGAGRRAWRLQGAVRCADCGRVARRRDRRLVRLRRNSTWAQPSRLLILILSLRRCGGDTMLVQLGDILDRGDSEAECWELLQRLKEEAPASGGGVVCLIGIHLCSYGDATPRPCRTVARVPAFRAPYVH